MRLNPHWVVLFKKRRSHLLAAVLISYFSGLSPALSAGTLLYDNGADPGTNAVPISDRSQITDSFILTNNSTLTGVNFSCWVTNGAAATTVDWCLTTAPFGGATNASGTASLAQISIRTNAHGCLQIAYSFPLPPVNLSAGTHWLKLGREQVSRGVGYWGQSGGPSSAWLFQNQNPNSPAPVATPSQSFLLIGIEPMPLNLQSAENDAHISWPTAPVTFQVEQNSAPGTATNWVMNTNTAKTSSGASQVPIAPTAENIFYGLMDP